MVRSALVAALLAAPVWAVTPVQKVITMLGEMKAKGLEEIQKEKVAFATFSQWCDDTSASKANSIEQAALSMTQLSALMDKSNEDAAELSRSIAVLDGTLATLAQEKADAEALRKSEKSDFLTTKADYEESIDALQRAQNVLKQQTHDRKQAQAAFLQVKSLSLLSASEKQKLSTLLEGKQIPVGGAEANAYEFQSGGAIDMLENLESKFVDELRALQKSEANNAHAHNLNMQANTDNTATAQKQRDSEAALMQKKKMIAGKAEGDLADTTATHDADSKYLADLKAECSMKTRDFENRQKLRSEEVAAIESAVEILSSKAVSGNAAKYLPQLVQKSFIQLASKVSKVMLPTDSDDKEAQLVQYLQQAAKKQNSKTLSLAAMRAQTSMGGPFDKVTKMIEGLIAKLMEEANAEAEKNGWCVTELATNKMTREDKSKAADALRAEIEGLQAEIASQSTKIQELNENIQASDAAVAEATKERNEEKARNTQTVKDAKEAQEAVAQAVAVLQQFYEGASSATSLLQQSPAEDAPATFNSAYKGQQASSGGVLGMLEVIQSDFVRLETETSTAESQAAKAYQTFMDDSSENKAVNEAEVDHLTRRRTRNENDLGDAQKELAVTENELQAALDYYETLKPSCVQGPGDYAARKAAREEEIDSLKEALTILDS